MKAMVTGASSGLGYDMAKVLSEKGYDIVAVGRNFSLLEKLKNDIASIKRSVAQILANTEYLSVQNSAPYENLYKSRIIFSIINSLPFA